MPLRSIDMYRIRFSSISQLFDVPEGVQVVMPLKDILRGIGSSSMLIRENRLIAEIPSVLWEGSVPSVREDLEKLKDKGVRGALCENIGAVNMCAEAGIDIHGGMYLNVLNVPAIEEYAKLGAKDLTLSFEMPFGKQRELLKRYATVDNRIELGILVYGYLPLMKFRACPAMGPEGCKRCSRDKELIDRKGEHFRILCHDSKYSELLNCVPLYASDRNLPPLDFYTLYFTTETAEECRNIFDMVRNKENPPFRRTAGLYNRELL